MKKVTLMILTLVLLTATQVVTSAMDKAVAVDLYFEALCEGCKEFIMGMLYPTWKALIKTGIMSLSLVPFGNAQQWQNPDGSWAFTCQHGPSECLGNRIQACIIKRAGNDSTLYFPTIFCMESTEEPIKAAEECIRSHSSFSPSDITQCAQGVEGNQLLHQMGVRTQALRPQHTYVPWIVVNGIHNEKVQDQAEADLLSLVCQTYTGDKPAVCPSETMESTVANEVSGDNLRFITN